MRITFLSLVLLITYSLAAQQLVNSDYGAYIEKYKSAAIREMHLYKIPASITLAQGMIESGCGKSVLAINTLNHFGIKCQNDWTGDTYRYDDDEKNECFRKYNSVAESYRDHSIFLSTRSRYAELFTLPITDYKGWANGLKKAGYATNPDYPNILIRLIEANKLYLYDESLENPIAKETTIAEAKSEKKSETKSEAKTEKKKKANQVAVPESGLTYKEGRILLRKSYRTPDPSAFETIYTSDMGRKVYENYGVPFIFAKKGDNWISVAKEFKIFSFQVFRQNDLLESDPILPGQILYLESKKKKNPEKVYKVKSGDSMYSISQEKCIKLKQLLKYNHLQPGDEPRSGSEVKLAR
jgi:flagellum-specific peptidoglycan hydrolase FlgJ